VLGFIVIAISAQSLSVFQNVLLSWWAQENDRNIQMMVIFEKKSVFFWLITYGFLGISYSAFVVFQVLFAWVFCGIRSARILHINLLENVLRLPQSFFDTTPLGRIMNRFSKDVYTADEVLPRSFLGYFRTMFIVISVLAVNTIGNPYYLVLAFPLGLVYYYCQKYYLSTSRELKRLDSTSRSPIYSNFQETLNGVTTIRAFGQETRFIQLNANRVDTNQRAYYPSVSSNRWLAIRLEFIGSLIVFGSATAGVLAIYFDKKMSSSVIGLMLVYSLSVTQTLNWMVRQSCEIETNIVSVERLKEYTEVPQEAPAVIPNNTPPSAWPNQGEIAFKNYAARYRPDLDLVIRNLNFQIKPQEKIGLVGRTGSGKSTLTLSLFRIIEPACGTILIDGVDISKIGLFHLRSALSIIPQEPILFNGPIRQNLDPFNSCSDNDIWEALGKVNLKAYISSFPEGLEHIVLQNGENFSVGQRQLICLARALVRKSKILILDEATAAIDVETDSIIQKTIRTDMKYCTVLTIAHRINTVMDSDRILVLDRGTVIEFDTPKALLSNKSGVFYSLAKEAGQTK
jgi:ATP-binding cassette, subfamily C (CFTR/MRP), member 1